MTGYVLLRDEAPVSGRVHAYEAGAFMELQAVQSQSCDWAMRFEGYALREIPERDVWPEDEAMSLTKQAMGMLGRHQHDVDLDGDPEAHLIRENCGACTLNGYGADQEDPGPNHAGWTRVYVQARRSIRPDWWPTLLADLAEGSRYSDALARDIRTWGVKGGGALPPEVITLGVTA